MYSSILFKFSRDVEVAPRMYLYGGLGVPSDENAMKAASNELEAANEYLKNLPNNYMVPMQCHVDFQGFRIVCIFFSMQLMTY